MARVVQDTKLAKREQRLKLESRKKPHWMTLNEGEHLGYYRGARVGKWVARYRRAGAAGNYQETTLAEADDNADADGSVILNFKQAQDAARKWFLSLERNGGRRTGAYTVSHALDDYLAGFQGKDLANTSRRIEAIVRPQMGKHEVAKLTTKAINDWLLSLASAPARLRTAKGAEQQNVRQTADTEEARRRRRSSANRILTILKAALNAAYREGKASADDAWRRVKPFAKADAPKLRYLSDDEARRLVNACDPAFRPLVQAALLTGARYSELAGLEVRDFDRQSQTIWLRETKAGIARAVYLEGEGVRLIEQATLGKPADALIFPRPDGKRWGPSQQARPLAAACAAAKLASTGFHDLRRTYGARLALRGVPMAVIAEALGHADERITRRHYAHLSKSYVADTVRSAVTGLGIVESGNVVRLEAVQ
jgi:integrase